MRKYGIDKFVFIVSIKNIPVDKLDYYERLWIKKLDTMNPEHGYNLAPGGSVLRGKDNPMFGKRPWNKGVPRTEEEKEHMRQGQDRDAMSKRVSGSKNPMYHHVYTEAELIKLSERQRGENNGFYGKHHSDKTKQLLKQANSNNSKPVDMIDAHSGEILNHFDSTHEAARFINDLRGSNNADKSFISRCAAGKHHIAYGFIWKFSERCND